MKVLYWWSLILEIAFRGVALARFGGWILKDDSQITSQVGFAILPMAKAPLIEAFPMFWSGEPTRFIELFDLLSFQR